MEKTSVFAAPAATSNVVLVAPVNPAAEAARVYPVPLLSRLRVEKLATPATAGTVVVPESVPPDGFVPLVIVMSPVNDSTVLLPASWAVTCTAGVILSPPSRVDR